jgi:serine/threonine-protein kinase
MSPSGGSSDLPAGASWTNPLGYMMITVDSADASSAHITVTNTMPIVPSVLSVDDAPARSIITAAGLTVGAVTWTASCAMPRGDVVIQNPQPGAQVPRGTPVNLQESTGRKANGKPCVIE